MRRGAWIVPAEDLLVPQRLVPVELGLPGLEDGLLALNDTPLPGLISAQIGVPVLFEEPVVVSLSSLLRLFGLLLDVLLPGCLAQNLLCFGHCAHWGLPECGRGWRQ